MIKNIPHYIVNKSLNHYSYTAVKTSYKHVWSSRGPLLHLAMGLINSLSSSTISGRYTLLF